MRVTLFMVMIAMASCQTVRQSSEIKTELKPIAGFYYPTLMLRRPVAPGADPLALPGERGFESTALPDEHWDCQSPSQFLADLNDAKVAELRACLGSLSESKPFDLRYRMDFNDPLQFKIVSKEDAPAPACLTQTLPVLPAPREIVYQTSDGPGERVDCYATRIAYERDLFLGLWELHPLELKVAMPLGRVPADAAEMRALLMSWVLAPFWHESERSLRSRLMSDAICKKCLGADRMIDATNTSRPPIWP